MTGQRFHGKVALITGGASGLGASIGRRLASEGASVAIFDADRTKLDQAAIAAAASHVRIKYYLVDIMQEQAVHNAVRDVEHDLGPIDIMVNAAGIVGPNAVKIVDYPLASFDQVYAVNLRGSFIMTKAVLPTMLRRNTGRVLLIASIAGKDGNPGMCGYSATKAGVIGLVKGVGKEYAETGVTINALAPAVIMTDMVRNMDASQVDYMVARIPMKRLGTLDEVASMATWIVSDECSFCTGFAFDLSGGRAVY